MLLGATAAEASTPEIGNNCTENCAPTYKTIPVCWQEPTVSCGWEIKWVSYWWGSFPYYYYGCTAGTKSVCTNVEVADGQTCSTTCTRTAFPPVNEQPLLNALNYWDTQQFMDYLLVDQAVAEAITQARVVNGGVFFGLEEVNAEGFDPMAHLNNEIVQEKKAEYGLLAPQVAYNNQVELFIDGPEQLVAVLDLIDSATQYIHLNTMLFLDDVGGQAIAHALKAAAQRGVIVRVMFDYFTTDLASSNRDSGEAVAGTPINPGLGVKDIILSGCQPGVVCDVRSTSQETEFWDYDWYDSLGWFSDSVRSDLKAAGVPEAMLIMQDYIQDATESALNVVNHQKYMIVDGKRMMLASANFGVNYQYEQSFAGGPKWQWHDGLSIVTGPLVKHAHRMFAQQWFVNTRGDIYDFTGSFYAPPEDEVIATNGTAPMALMVSFPGDGISELRHLNIRYIKELLQSAPGQVLIENPYVTDGELWSTLAGLTPEQASRTSLITNLVLTDSPYNGATVRCRGRAAAENGLKVYAYHGEQRFSHLKLTVDVGRDMVHYGSYNLNSRSRLHDFELNFVVRDAALTKHAKEVLENDIQNSTLKGDLDYYHTSPLWTPECTMDKVTNWFT
jgi:cardiolipin synthase